MHRYFQTSIASNHSHICSLKWKKNVLTQEEQSPSPQQPEQLEPAGEAWAPPPPDSKPPPQTAPPPPTQALPPQPPPQQVVPEPPSPPEQSTHAPPQSAPPQPPEPKDVSCLLISFFFFWFLVYSKYCVAGAVKWCWIFFWLVLGTEFGFRPWFPEETSHSETAD